jgi:hypothetical protein
MYSLSITWLLLVGYLVVNGLISWVLYWLTRTHSLNPPKLMEAVVYFAVFIPFGLPILLGTMCWNLFESSYGQMIDINVDRGGNTSLHS